MDRVQERRGVGEDEVVEGDVMEGRIHVCKADGHRGSWGGINSSPSCTALNALVAAESEVDWEIFGGAAPMMDSGWWNRDVGR